MYALEVKAKPLVQDRDLRGLMALDEERQIKKFAVISLDPHPRRMGKMDILPWRIFVQKLWSGDLFKA